MKTIGYIRVSSQKQTTEHQKYEIEQFAKNKGITINHWVKETISSRKPLNKRKLGELLNTLETNDILISCEISRLGRSMTEVLNILENCLSKDCQVWTIKENYILGNDIQSKVLAFAFGLSAEIERNLISQRTKASLENIKASGKKLGRPLSSQSKKLKLTENKDKIKSLLKNNVSKSEIARKLNVQRVTLTRFINRMEWNAL